MGLDIDAVFITQEIEKLEDIISELGHGEKSDICDDITKFVEQMENKYSK